MTYFNEIDRTAAAWTRELIKQRVVNDGIVDERSIEDVLPDDVIRYERAHFFAGIGVWDHVLNEAGWNFGRTWTGSCPCQPFSEAGKRSGFDDERHLWPAWFHLIEQCRPDFIFGEQVASKNGLTWLDLVCADLEGCGYAIGATDTPACGFGAPHKRNRIYFFAYKLANTQHDGRDRSIGSASLADRDQSNLRLPDGDRAAGGVADTERDGAIGVYRDGFRAEAAYKSRGSRVWADEARDNGTARGLEITSTLGRRGWGYGNTFWYSGKVQTAGRCSSGGMGDAESERSYGTSDSAIEDGPFGSVSTKTASSALGLVDTELRRSEQCDPSERSIQELDAGRDGGVMELAQGSRLEGLDGSGDIRHESGRISPEAFGFSPEASLAMRGAANGYWGDPDWVWCNDPGAPRWRPVESGTFPLAPRSPGRVGLLRGYGNTIVAPQAVEFVKAAKFALKDIYENNQTIVQSACGA